LIKGLYTYTDYNKDRQHSVLKIGKPFSRVAACAAINGSYKELSVKDIRYIGQNAFSHSKVLKAKVYCDPSIAEGSTICDEVFAYCTDLKEVRFEGRLDGIPDYCFTACINLQDVYVPKGLIVIGRNAFYCMNSVTIHHPEGTEFIIHPSNNNVDIKFVKEG